MPALTRFVLRHKALVALFWLVVAVAGVMTIGGTTHRMTNNFAMPGQAFKVDNQIAREYGNGGSQAPYLPVLTVPAGQRVTDPAVAAETGRVFAALARAIPGRADRRLRDDAQRAFVTRDGRSTFALVFTAPATGFGGPDLGPAIAARHDRGRAGRLARRGHRLAAAGQREAVRVQGHRDHGRGDDRVAGRAGHPGAGVRQLPGAAAAAHRRHLGAGHVPARGRADRDHRGQPDRGVPDRADRARRGDRLLAARGQPLAGGAGGGPGQRRPPCPRR